MSSSSLPQTFSEVKSEVSRKSPRAEGSSTGWLSDLGVKPGEFQHETTGRLRKMCESWPAERGRVWACLSLHSLGYRQEIAVKLANGRLEPLTRADIARETGLEQGHVRRALVALEQEGWVERVSLTEGGKLQRGEIAIRVFVTPRPAQFVESLEDGAAAQPALDIPDSLPAILVAWAKRRKCAAVLVGLADTEAQRLTERALGLERAETDLEAAFDEILESRAQITTGPRAGSVEPVEKSAHRAARRNSRGSALKKTGDLNLKEDKQRDKQTDKATTAAGKSLSVCLPELISEPKTLLCEMLTSRGVLPTAARRLVQTLSEADAESGLDQIDWLDREIQRSTAKPNNAAAVYYSAVKKRSPLPADWETRAARREREQAQRETQWAAGETAAAETEEMEAREKYDAFIAAQVDAHLATLPEATVKRRLSGHMERIQVNAPQYHWPVETLRGFALKALRAEIAREFADVPDFEVWRATV